MDLFPCRAMNEFSTNRFLAFFYLRNCQLHEPKSASSKDPFLGRFSHCALYYPNLYYIQKCFLTSCLSLLVLPRHSVNFDSKLANLGSESDSESEQVQGYSLLFSKRSINSFKPARFGSVAPPVPTGTTFCSSCYPTFGRLGRTPNRRPLHPCARPLDCAATPTACSANPCCLKLM